jgi:hypothetical protein
LVLACFALAPASAQSAPPASPTGWQFQITPYLWGSGLSGDVGVGKLQATGVEASFSDILSDLHFAFMGAFEARTGRWGFLTDAIYVDLSASKPTPNGLFGNADVSLTDQIYTALGMYRVSDGKCKVDVLFGPRYSSLDTDLTLTSGVAAGRTASGGVSWWDAIGGARLTWQSEKGWLVSGYADIGGGSDDFTWEAVAAGGYRFKKLVTLSLGYRYLSVDYDDDRVVYDMAMAGPFLGVGFRF